MPTSSSHGISIWIRNDFVAINITIYLYSTYVFSCSDLIQLFHSIRFLVIVVLVVIESSASSHRLHNVIVIIILDNGYMHFVRNFSFFLSFFLFFFFLRKRWKHSINNQVGYEQVVHLEHVWRIKKKTYLKRIEPIEAKSASILNNFDVIFKWINLFQYHIHPMQKYFDFISCESSHKVFCFYISFARSSCFAARKLFFSKRLEHFHFISAGF